METNKELMRAEFENRFGGKLNLLTHINGEYQSGISKLAWEVWHVALSQRSEAVPSSAAGDQVLAKLRDEFKRMQDNLETFGQYGQETARVAIDGCIDALDEIDEEHAQPTPAQGDAVPVATKCAACNGEGWVRDIHDMEQGRIRCTKCATRQSSADAVDAAKWREWAAMCKRVDSELPDGWLITYDMGPEVWGVSLRNPDGEHVGFHTCDCESDAEMVICALDAAIAAQGGKG